MRNVAGPAGLQIRQYKKAVRIHSATQAVLQGGGQPEQAVQYGNKHDYRPAGLRQAVQL